MAKARSTTTRGQVLGDLRAILARGQTRGERMVARFRRDAETFVARSRNEAPKEVRALGRRLLRGRHAATREQVARMERRIAKLERAVDELERGGTGGFRAA